MTKVTAIIPSLVEVDREYLQLCVESLRSTVDWPIIVVTNGGRTTMPLDKEWVKGKCQHYHSPAQGQCRAVNVGAQLAPPDTEYLFVVNSDMYFAPGWNKNLRFDHPCFSPNLVEPTNNLGSAPPFLKLDGGFTLDEFNKELVDKQILDLSDNDDPDESGFNLPFFIRKDVWDTIGGYDEAYDPFGSNSDTDLQTRIALAGIIPRRLRDVLVYHFSNKSGTFDFNQEGRQALWQKNFDYFRNKFGFTRDDVPGCDVWYHQNMLPEEGQIKYRPEWIWKYLDEE